MATLVLPFLDTAARGLIHSPRGPAVDFTQPKGEPALVAPDSVSWRIFKNPVALFIGGVAAVILELAEPAVRTGVWEHSSFRSDPVRRLQRTGLAAMVTVYGARSVAETMIAGVVRMHDKVRGATPAGESYHANDVRLLTWVQATAGYGFAEAFSRYVRPLGREELDALYREGAPAARLYGALDMPTSQAELHALFDSLRDRLEPSPIDMTPEWVRERLGLTAAHGLRAWERLLVRQAGALSDRILLRSSPAVQACRRLGLPDDYLYGDRRKA